MAKHLSWERKVLYYTGMGLVLLGIILFFANLVMAVSDFGNFDNFEERTKATMYRAFGGMAMIALGGILLAVGALGLAGSGIVLDPQMARRELEPYSRMAGGMVKDAFGETDLSLGAPSERVVMLKCPACGKLNGEDAKFCNECGGRV